MAAVAEHRPGSSGLIWTASSDGSAATSTWCEKLNFGRRRPISVASQMAATRRHALQEKRLAPATRRRHVLVMSFRDLLSLVRPSPAPGPAVTVPLKGKATAGAPPADPIPTPATSTELHAALLRLGEERDEAEAAILHAARRRDELLLLPDSDAAIRDLDAEVDRASLLIERLDRLKPEFLSKLREIEHEERRNEWEQLVSRYTEAASEYAQRLRAVEAVREQLYEIRRQGSGAFRAETDRFFPYPIDFERLRIRRRREPCQQHPAWCAARVVALTRRGHAHGALLDVHRRRAAPGRLPDRSGSRL